MHNIFLDPFQVLPALLESCRISASGSVISAECAYRNSTATGFLVIVKPSNSSNVHEIYTSKTTDRQTTASVEVEESGLYRVAIFPIRGGRGILDSHVEYWEQMMVDPTTAASDTTTTATTTTTTTSGATTTTNTSAVGKYVHINFLTDFCVFCLSFLATQGTAPISPSASAQTGTQF